MIVNGDAWICSSIHDTCVYARCNAAYYGWFVCLDLLFPLRELSIDLTVGASVSSRWASVGRTQPGLWVVLTHRDSCGKGLALMGETLVK